MNRLARCLIAAGLLGLSGAAWAASAVDALRQFVQGTRTLRAEFSQLVVSQGARKPQASSGVVMISRPGKLRWDIHKPYPQSLIGDGEKLWIYDQELQQVTVRAASKTLGGTPAALLAGSNELERSFELVDGGQRDGLAWADALPKGGEGSFSRVRFGFAGSELKAMELHDNFGQVTHIRFSRLERNPALPAGTFRFVPPAGVDVIGE